MKAGSAELRRGMARSSPSFVAAKNDQQARGIHGTAGKERKWLKITNIWRKRTSWNGEPRRLRGMTTTILRKYHSVCRCTLLGEMIEDTAHRYYYRRRGGAELTFVEKRSPVVHVAACKACPDYSSPAKSDG